MWTFSAQISVGALLPEQHVINQLATALRLLTGIVERGCCHALNALSFGIKGVLIEKLHAEVEIRSPV